MKTLLPILKTKLFLLGFVSTCTVILATTVPQIRNFIAPEKAIGEKITTEQKKISPKNKNQNRTVSSSRVTSGLSLEMNNSFEATVQTDKLDYMPGEYVIITGSGWRPGETVTLHFDETPTLCINGHNRYTNADDNGNIYFDKFLIGDQHLGVAFLLTATGQTSGFIAQTNFTDATWTLGVSPNAFCAIDARVVTFTVTQTNNGTPRNESISITVPTGFTIGTPSTPVISGKSWSSSLTNSTTVCLTANSPGGSNQLNSGDILTFTATVSAGSTAGSFALSGNGNGTSTCAISGGQAITSPPSFTVNALPSSTFTGATTVCPSSSNIYSGPADLTYAWSLVNPNGATISGSSTSQNVTVVAGSGNNSSYTLKLTTTDGNTCSSSSSQSVTVADNTAPTITATGSVANNSDLGCNPSASNINAALGSATATDNCGATTVTSVDGSVTGSCEKSQTRTFTAKDAVGNTSTAARTVTWIADLAPPVLTSGGTTTTLGCNPSAGDINGALGTATATDACGEPTVSQSDGSVSSNGCSRSQTRTFTAIDFCGNTSTASRTVTWIADLTPPVLTTGGTTSTLGCNPSVGDINSALGTATATDACGVPTVSQSDGTVSSNGCNRSQTRTFTAIDFCGNTSTASRTVTWIADLTPPVLTTGGTTTTLGCNPSVGDINGALGTATATDACGEPTVSQSDGTVSSTGCNRSQTRTFTAIDFCGNTSTASRTVTWIADLTPPVLTTGGTTTTLGCNPSAGDINGALGTATATDACGVPTVSQSDGTVSSNGCNRSQTRTFTAIDFCGNTSTASRTVTWIADLTPPVLTTGGTGTSLGCNPSAGDINGALGTATATDACGEPTVSQSDGSVSSNGCSRSQTRTFTAIDFCGNTSTASRTVTWIADLTPPVLTTGGTTSTLGCNPSVGDINGALGTATATDACGVPTVSQSDGTVSSNGCNRSQTRTFTAIDFCGNTSTASRTVTWIADLTPPVLTTGGTTTTLGCNPSVGDINGALGTATATDACGEPTVSQSDGSVSSNGCNRSQTRTFTAIDFCGNTSTASRTVTWIADLTPPVLTTGGTTSTLGCNPSVGDINSALGTATATDACGVPTVSQSDGTVSSNGCNRSQTRTFTAIDFCGNTSTASRTVTWIADLTPPVLTTGGTTTTLGCNPSVGDINGALGTATATDACGEPTVSQSDGTVSSTGCNRSQTRTFTAIDFCGNTSTASRTVTWIADLTPPVLTTGGTTSTLGCNPSVGDINGALGTATATDACGEPTVSQSDGSVSSNGCSRSQTRTFTAIDFCGNTSTASRTVTWIADLTPPVLATGGTGTSLGCNPSAGDINGALGTATATDACGEPTVSQSDGSVSSNGCSRSQTRTFTAIDFCGNTSTASRTVTWIADLTPPVLTTGGTTSTLGCNPSVGDINSALGTATATDACGVPTVSQSDGTVSSNGCNRSQTRTFTAIDFCGNTSTASRTVTWIADLTPPVLTTGGTTTTLGCNPSVGDINGALGTATATDACGEPTVSQSDGTVSSTGCNRSQTRTFTAIDFCGNTSTASRTVTWIADLTPPVLTTGGTTTTLGCNPSAGDINGALGTATATDACGEPTVSQSDGSVSSNSCSRSQTRTFTAIDFCGNTSTASRTITWIADLTPPVLTTGGSSLTLGCNPSAGDINGALGTATATDACGVPTVSQSDGTVSSDGCSRSQKRTFTARDFCGNTSTACRTVTWTADVTPPTITLTPAPAVQLCNPSAANIDAALGTATANDACGTPTVTFIDGNVAITSCSRSQTRTFTARDGCNNTATISRTVTWTSDITGPTIPGTFVSQTCLWPPNHKMVDIYLTAATDGCAAILTNTVTVTSNEPDNDIGDGNTEDDTWVDPTNPLHIRVRAERSGVKSLTIPDSGPDYGRIYTVTYTTEDACGNISTATNTIMVAHNITAPNTGNSCKIGTTVALAGTFWDLPGNTHTAKWLVDGTSVNGTILSEPNGNKMGKVSGSYKPTAAGIYKLRMNVTNQKGVTGYATTNGDHEAFLVVYDPNGGYTYGGGKFVSPDNAAISNPGMTGHVAFGFASNYFKNATNPKGETELVFKDGGVEFNAVNYDVLLVEPQKSKATYRGLGKTIINGVEQSGYAFLMVVIDGKTPANPDGTDRIRIKIYNKNTNAIIYDNQPGAPDDADPIIPVDDPLPDGCNIVVVNTPTNNTSADLTSNSQMEVVPVEIGAFNVRAFPNPSEHVFSLVLENATNEKVQIVVYDAIGRQVKMFEKQSGNIPIRFGMDLKVGVYVVEVRQGDNRKTLKLVKQ